MPGALLLLLALALSADIHRFAESFLLYGARAWPSLVLEWHLRREVEPALERRDPDAALAALARIESVARLFEERVAPFRIRAWLEKDHIPRALSLYSEFLESGLAAGLPDPVHEALGPHLEGLQARQRNTEIRFEDVTGAAGVRFVHGHAGDRLAALYQAMGSGLALLDLDADGALDLLLLGGDLGDGRGNLLLRNRGDGGFVDVTAGSGLARTGLAYGVAAADLTGDALPELYVTGLGENHLLRNLGGMRFEDVTDAAGARGLGGASMGAAFGDVDGDGDLDLYVTQWVRGARRDPGRLLRLLFSERSRLALFAPHMYPPDRNLLLRNEGNLRFVDVTEAAGVADPEGRGLGVVVTDLTGDALPEIFVANDVSPNRLFLNRGQGRFEDVSARTRTLDARAGMGIAVSDWNGDGAMDLFTTNFRTEHNALLVNRPERGVFSEETQRFGLAAGSLGVTSWGVVSADFDRDGDADLIAVNGHPTPFDPRTSAFRGESAEQARCLPEPPLVYERREDGFVDVTPGAGALGSFRGVGRGLVGGDLDRDGRLDLVLSTNNGGAHVFRNVSPRAADAHWLVVRPRWRAPNRLAVGARVRVETAAGVQEQVMLAGSSYLSQAPFELYFGLGPAQRARRVLVTWPDGSASERTDVPADQILELDARLPRRGLQPSSNGGAG